MLPIIFNRSCIIPLLENYLRNDSLLDMTRFEQHSGVYSAVFDLVDRMAKQSRLLFLMNQLPGQSTSILGLLQVLSAQASTFLLRSSKGNARLSESRLMQQSQNGTVKPETKLAMRLSSLATSVNSKIKRFNALQEEKEEERKLQEKLQAESEKKQLEDEKKRDSKENRVGEEEEEGDKKKQKGIDKKENQGTEDIYINALKPNQFVVCNLVNERGDYVHHYIADANKAGAPKSSKLMRIAQEMGTLATSLPLSYESSVFVCSDEDRIELMKAMITGTPGTPYASGCFLFDIFFPADYPKVPPLFNFLTTGQGTVRFNPNLYNNGKVCLSLLGTWSGTANEMWQPKRSTVLSVLISIVAMILVADPYFNEPGYEVWRGTSTGTDRSRLYNQTIREATVRHAMLGHLREEHHDTFFREAIRRHFFIKQKEVDQQVLEWVEDAPSGSAHRERMVQLHKELRTSLIKLSKEMRSTIPLPDSSLISPSIPAICISSPSHPNPSSHVFFSTFTFFFKFFSIFFSFFFFFFFSSIFPFSFFSPFFSPFFFSPFSYFFISFSFLNI